MALRAISPLVLKSVFMHYGALKFLRVWLRLNLGQVANYSRICSRVSQTTTPKFEPLRHCLDVKPVAPAWVPYSAPGVSALLGCGRLHSRMHFEAETPRRIRPSPGKFIAVPGKRPCTR